MSACCAPGSPEKTAKDGKPVAPVVVENSRSRTQWRLQVAKSMVLLDGGSFLMGTDDKIGFPDDGEGPVREVRISPFYIDKYAVSNERFKAFADATGYKTEAERFGWSFVFQNYVPKILTKREKARRVPGLQWWYAVEGAYWNRPEGPGSDVRRRMDFPVVHISWGDAAAYCEWARLRLPTEAEWEYAARGGLVQRRYAWGNDLKLKGRHMCNIWQGAFPVEDTGADGYKGTCPVLEYKPNGYGLFNMAGNVWEWCADWFSPTHGREGSLDPRGPGTGTTKVMRGGSHLCHKSYCNRYRVAARTSNTPDSSTTNLGFRCVCNA